MKADRDLGICAIPLYDFTEEQIETVGSGSDTDEAIGLLAQRNLLQFFFPPADQIALGVAERTALESGEVVERVSLAPRLGHPFGPPEIVPPDTALVDMIDALRERKMLVEGEHTVEITEAGRTERKSIRFASREGLISKVINRFEVKIDITTRFFGG
jgi:hypothetical protein